MESVSSRGLETSSLSRARLVRFIHRLISSRITSRLRPNNNLRKVNKNLRREKRIIRIRIRSRTRRVMIVIMEMI